MRVSVDVLHAIHDWALGMFPVTSFSDVKAVNVKNVTTCHHVMTNPVFAYWAPVFTVAHFALLVSKRNPPDFVGFYWLISVFRFRVRFKNWLKIVQNRTKS